MEEENKVESLDETTTTPVVETIEPVTEAPTTAPVAVETPSEPAPAETPAEPVTEVPAPVETPTEAPSKAPAAETNAPTPEEVPAPKKKSGRILLILLILVLAFFVVWFFVLGGNEMLGLKKKAEEPAQQEEKKEEPGQSQEESNEENDNNEYSDGENKLTDTDKINTINSFYEIVKDGSFTTYPFYTGKDINDRNKMYVTIKSVFKNKKYETLTEDNLPEKYKGDESIKPYLQSPGYLHLVTFDTLEKEYLALFGENVSLTYDKVQSADTNPCTTENFYDTENKTVIFNSGACGEGITASVKYIKSYKYSYDNDHYYLYSYVAYNDLLNPDYSGKLTKISTGEFTEYDKFEGNEDKFDTVKWTFDKNLAFVSAELVK